MNKKLFSMEKPVKEVCTVERKKTKLRWFDGGIVLASWGGRGFANMCWNLILEVDNCFSQICRKLILEVVDGLDIVSMVVVLVFSEGSEGGD